jgi:UDP-N-acetyl-D-galactosamine dehydrogenase
VGLPLALEFGKSIATTGFDVSKDKVRSYQENIDPTGEQPREAFVAASKLNFTSEPAALSTADVIILAVPTPVDQSHRPDFEPLIRASQTVGKNMKRGVIVVYESTVYPGATEERCIPILEAASGMKWPADFNVGYSPERINPGDKIHILPNIVKIVAGDNPETLEKLATIYGRIISAGIHRASSIKVAEAAKVIENTQRDLNIALMNELAMIFNRLDIDTMEVLEAAGSKWNFLPFRPGLVGGHCIGVDPYYLTTKAEMVGYSPHVILAGRRINDAIGAYVARQVIKTMVSAGFKVSNEPIILLGLTFKENVSDVRNSKAVDIIRELQSYGARIYVHDPLARSEDAEHEYGIKLTAWEDLPMAAAIVAAVNHSAYTSMGIKQLAAKALPGAVFCDVKSAFDLVALKALGLKVWRL